MGRAACNLALPSTATLAGACAVGPRYVAPHESPPDAFRCGYAIRARQASGAHADASQRWRSFGVLLVAMYVERARSQNLGLPRVEQARAPLGAALLPSGQIRGHAGEHYQSQRSPIGRIAQSFAGFDWSTELYELDVGASWEIDVFGALSRSKGAARADCQASQGDVQAARLSVAAQTVDTYITIRALQARIVIAREQVETQQQLVDTTPLQYWKGTTTVLHLKHAQGVLAQAASTVPVLERDLDAASNALDVLIGAQPGSSRRDLAEPRAVSKPPAIADAGGSPALLRRRPDIVSAERRLAASNTRIDAAISEYYPKFPSADWLAAPAPMLQGSSPPPQRRRMVSWACAGARLTSAGSTRRSKRPNGATMRPLLSTD